MDALLVELEDRDLMLADDGVRKQCEWLQCLTTLGLFETPQPSPLQALTCWQGSLGSWMILSIPWRPQH